MKIGKLLIFTALLLNNSLCWSEGTNFKPAKFKKNIKGLEKKIKYPDDPYYGKTVIRVAAESHPGGYLWPIFFYRDSAQDQAFIPYEESVKKIIRLLKVTTPKVNGRRNKVWFNFSVIFDNSDGKKEVRIVPNFLYNENKYGENYSDPQRIITKRSFPSECGVGNTLWMASTIDQNGKALDSRVIEGEGSRECREQLKKLMLASDYMPARHEGNFVPATYIEAFWYHDDD